MQEIKDVNRELFERADAMAFELAARAYAFSNDSDFVDSQASGYCNSIEEVQECNLRAKTIREILVKSCKSELSQGEIKIIQEAAKEWKYLT